MSSYRQILKSTALVGGTQIVNQCIGIARTKALAVLLGPSGMGVAGLYLSTTSMIGAISGLGLNSSGVRQIAEASGSGDERRVARTIINLRRLSLLSGGLGLLGVVALSPVLSRITFGDAEHVGGIALMSLTLLFGGISAGQSALLQGLRRLKELAASQVVGAVSGTVLSVFLVWWLRERGIVPFLISISAFGILLSWWFARRVPLMPVTVTWKETLLESRGLLGLGIAFTTSALISNGSAYLARVIVNHQLGIDAVGIYTAAWTLSTYYVGFVLSAMGADFLPRLTSSVNDHESMARLVNEQTELGVLIALPGVLATLALARWVLNIFYSDSFVLGAGVVQWQILGVLLRVVSWPLAYVAIAKGRSALMMLAELTYGLTSTVLIFVCVDWWGLEGVGVSFALSYVVYSSVVWFTARRLIGFRWAGGALRHILAALMASAAVFLGMRVFPANAGVCIGLAAAAVSGLYLVRRICGVLDVSLLDSMRSRFRSIRTK